MLESGRKTKVFIALGALLCFLLGFTTANKLQKINWLGHLVHGVYNEPEPSIVPMPDEFLPEVDDDIIIGLREDGVVVWKKANQTEK